MEVFHFVVFAASSAFPFPCSYPSPFPFHPSDRIVLAEEASFHTDPVDRIQEEAVEAYSRIVVAAVVGSPLEGNLAVVVVVVENSEVGNPLEVQEGSFLVGDCILAYLVEVVVVDRRGNHLVEEQRVQELQRMRLWKEGM